MKKRSGAAAGGGPLMRWFSTKAGEFLCHDSVQMSVPQTLQSERADVLNALIKSATATHVFLLVVRAHEVEP